MFQCVVLLWRTWYRVQDTLEETVNTDPRAGCFVIGERVRGALTSVQPPRGLVLSCKSASYGVLGSVLPISKPFLSLCSFTILVLLVLRYINDAVTRLCGLANLQLQYSTAHLIRNAVIIKPSPSFFFLQEKKRI